MAVKLYRKLVLFKQFFCKKDGRQFSLITGQKSKFSCARERRKGYNPFISRWGWKP